LCVILYAYAQLAKNISKVNQQTAVIKSFADICIYTYTLEKASKCAILNVTQ